MYYARSNQYGDEASAGFANTHHALAFETRRERDAWVAENEDKNMAVCAITAAQARRMTPADGYGRRTYSTADDGYARV